MSSNTLQFDIDGELSKALKYHRSGQLEKAERICKSILEITPHHSASWHVLGIIAHETGKNDAAANHIKKAIENDPQNPFLYNNLGMVLQKQGKLNQAIRCYQNAVQLNPHIAGVYYNMGNTLRDQGKSDEAISCYQKALQLKPDYAEAYNNMGGALHDQGKLDEAVSCYQKALQLKPGIAEAHNNMGIAFQDEGKSDEAISCYQKALEINPSHAEAYKNMGDAFQDQGKSDEAISCYQKALEIEPDPGIDVKRCLLLPVICRSNVSIQQYRKQIIEQIKSLQNSSLRLKDPYKQVGSTNFFLAYHALNDKEIQKLIASFYIDACADLARTPSNYAKRQKTHDPIKIGIISKFLYSHTIGKLNRGIVEHLSRRKFYVKLFRFQGREDHLSRIIDSAADEVVILPTVLTAARQKIAEHPLDILYYLDIGMDSLTYFLAFSRLAPVQCVTWGHPVTTGIPNMDYFISSSIAEPPEGEHHYSERLVLLKRLPIYYYRPHLSGEPSSREAFGLPNDFKLYVCPQSLFKFHPDFDEVLHAILCQDPRALLVLIEGKHEHWTKMLRDRFAGAFPDAIDRVWFLPRMTREDFLSLLMVADVVLDTIHFGGGNTSLEAFALGVPIVTLPGRFLRGRLTLALYKQMGVMDCVAHSVESYVNLALRLANDKTWRDEIRAKIRGRADVLYEDMEAVRELECFFEWAVKEEPKRTLT